MSGGFKVYSSKEVSVSINGIPIDTVGGYAEDEFLTIERVAPDFEEVVGVDGEVTRSQTNNRLAKVKLKLMQSSSANALLSALNNLDVNTAGGAGVGPFLVRDRQGTSLYTGSKCYIAKPPDAAFGSKAKPREWDISVADLKRFDGGN